MAKSKVVAIIASEARLKRRLRRHLASLGFDRESDGRLIPKDGGKASFRSMHVHHRAMRIDAYSDLINSVLPRFLPKIADGSEIDPARIRFALQRIEPETIESSFFRLASLSWSVPVSNGFGRRLRYLVWDESNGRIAGLIAIGDPVFNLGVRDKLIGWNAKERAERLANVLDAYVLGALPPYNGLLGGKVIACLLRTKDIYDDFARKYGSLPGVISGRNKKPRLLAITTSSALGRSSIYNRLKLDGTCYLKSIGFTEGWGHFHVPDDLFDDLRKHLVSIDHPYAKQNRFGHGPNWKLRTIREGLKALGLNEATLHHGLRREVFLSELAQNSLQILKSGRGKPDISNLKTVADVSAAGVERWMIARSATYTNYREWRRENFRELIGRTSTLPNSLILPGRSDVI